MRFFRIPSFTGIETHRDDADRGSLRVVEGCLPFGPGGLRSGPVWKNVGSVQVSSHDEENQLLASDDGNGNSALFVTRLNEVHEMALSTTEHTEVSIFVSTYSVVDPLDLYRNERAVLSPVGNRLFSFGDSDGEAVFIGKGPPTAQASVFPDETLYSYEWSRFPNCKFFVQGPKKTLFASGNPDKPLTVYISEPASKTSPYRDTPYSTSNTNQFPGSMSTVDILGSNASEITALSTRGDQVVVHTDKGCHLLYAPSSDQAETGYRVEQAPATNFSAAVNPQVVGGENGTMSYWLGHDGQIYKDESSSRGAEDKKSQADPDQASWKAKGLWEKELPVDLTDSFATYDPQSGMYWFFVRSDENKKASANDLPGRPFLLTAAPDLPGQVSGFIAELQVPGSVSGLSALPEGPGQVTNLSLLITPDGVSGLSALPDGPGQVTNLSLLVAPDTPVLKLPVSLSTSSIQISWDAIPDASSYEIIHSKSTSTDKFSDKEDPIVVSGNSYTFSNLSPAGQIYFFTIRAVNAAGSSDWSNIVSALTLVNVPGSVSSLTATPDLPGTVTGLTSTVSLPGAVSGLSALPDAPGMVTGFTAQAALTAPGAVNAFTALPDSPGAVSGLTAAVDASCSNIDQHYWNYVPATHWIDSFEDINGNRFGALTNGLMLTGVPVYGTILGRFTGQYLYFPNTLSDANSAATNAYYWDQSSGSVYANKIPEGSDPYTGTHLGGVSKSLGINSEYQYWAYLRPDGTNSSTGAWHFELQAVEKISGTWKNVQYRITQTSSGAYEIGKWWGVSQLERWYKADGAVCGITGKYNNYNSSNWFLYIGLSPYSYANTNSSSDRGGASHADGTTFKLDYTV